MKVKVLAVVVPADINDLAALGKDVRVQHGQGQVGLDDPWASQTVQKQW